MPTSTNPVNPVDETGTGDTGGTGGTGTGTGAATASAIPPGHASPQFEIRLWSAALTGWRVLDASLIVPSVSARITAIEGYEKARFSVWGSPNDDALVGLVPRRRVEFWATYKDTVGTLWEERLYSGIIRITLPGKSGSDGGKASVVVELKSVWEDAANCPCKKRYANPAQVDKSTWFADMAARFVQSRYPAIMVDAQPVGDIADTLDAYNVRFGDAVNTLSQNTGRLVTGGARLTQDAYAPDSLFMRPYEASTALAHVIDFSSEQVGSRGDDLDDTKRSTELNIRGGPLADTDRENLLGRALNGGSTSFECPVIPGADGAGNLAQNPSFENGDKTNPTSWALHGGAIRDQQDDGIAPFSGSRYLRLNHVNDDAFQLLIPEEAVVTGRAYVLDCRARLGSPSYPASGLLKFQWRNSSGAYFGDVFSFTISPTDTVYNLFGGTVVPPDGAVALSIAPTCTVSASTLNALIIDDVRFFDASAVQQKGWEAVSDQEDGAYFKAIRWDDDTTFWHGARSVYVDVVAFDDDGRNARIRPTNLARFPVAGGAHLLCGAFVKLAPGSPNVLVRPELHEWHAGGQYQGKTETGTVNLSATDWTLIMTDRQFQSDAEEASFAVQFRGSGQLYIDGCFVFAYAAGAPSGGQPERFVEGDAFEITLYAKDLFAPTDAPYLAYTEIGNVPETEERPEITTLEDAQKYAIDYFNRYAVLLDRPTAETFGVMPTGRGTTASLWPGEQMRGIGPDALNVLPTAEPLVEKEITWDGKLIIKLFCNNPPRDPARATAEIARKALRAQGTQIAQRAGSVGRGTSSNLVVGVNDMNDMGGP